MEGDNLYPNDGTFLGGVPLEPLEQTVERKKERAKTLEDVKILQDIVAHFEARIEFLGSVDAMDDGAKLDPQKFLIVHNANEIARHHLRSEKEWVQSLLDNVGPVGI